MWKIRRCIRSGIDFSSKVRQTRPLCLSHTWLSFFFLWQCFQVERRYIQPKLQKTDDAAASPESSRFGAKRSPLLVSRFFRGVSGTLSYPPTIFWPIEDMKHMEMMLRIIGCTPTLEERSTSEKDLGGVGALDSWTYNCRGMEQTGEKRKKRHAE